MKTIHLFFYIVTILIISCTKSEKENSKEIIEQEKELFKKVSLPNMSFDSAFVENDTLILIITDSSDAMADFQIQQRVGYLLSKKVLDTKDKITSNEVKIKYQMPYREKGGTVIHTNVYKLIEIGSIYGYQEMQDIGEYIFEKSFIESDINKGFYLTMLNVELAVAKYGSGELAAEKAFSGINSIETFSHYFFHRKTGQGSDSEQIMESVRIVEQFIKNQTTNPHRYKSLKELDPIIPLLKYRYKSLNELDPIIPSLK